MDLLNKSTLFWIMWIYSINPDFLLWLCIYQQKFNRLSFQTPCPPSLSLLLSLSTLNSNWGMTILNNVDLLNKCGFLTLTMYLSTKIQSTQLLDLCPPSLSLLLSLSTLNSNSPNIGRDDLFCCVPSILKPYLDRINLIWWAWAWGIKKRIWTKKLVNWQDKILI